MPITFGQKVKVLFVNSFDHIMVALMLNFEVLGYDISTIPTFLVSILFQHTLSSKNSKDMINYRQILLKISLIISVVTIAAKISMVIYCSTEKGADKLMDLDDEYISLI